MLKNVTKLELLRNHTQTHVQESRLTFTCSKSTIETIEKGVKYAQKLTIKTPEQRQAGSKSSQIKILFFKVSVW